ncbi:hypothetical protein AAVH_22981, partial [Aphelenchoides avenae]
FLAAGRRLTASGQRQPDRRDARRFASWKRTADYDPHTGQENPGQPPMVIL